MKQKFFSKAAVTLAVLALSILAGNIFFRTGRSPSVTRNVQADDSAALKPPEVSPAPSQVRSLLHAAAKTNKIFLTANGLFGGKVTDPSTLKSFSFKGAVAQNENFGFGFFLVTNQSGSVLFRGN